MASRKLAATRARSCSASVPVPRSRKGMRRSSPWQSLGTCSGAYAAASCVQPADREGAQWWRRVIAALEGEITLSLGGSLPLASQYCRAFCMDRIVGLGAAHAIRKE
jgi:hypothetical protein